MNAVHGIRNKERGRTHMSALIVVAYPDEYRAAEVLATVRRLQAE